MHAFLTKNFYFVFIKRVLRELFRWFPSSIMSPLFICILHTRKIFFNTKNTVLVLKTSETTTELNSCGTKNTLNDVINCYDQICHRRERMKTTITCSTVTPRHHKFKKFLILKILIKCAYWDQPNLVTVKQTVVKRYSCW